MDRDLRPGHEPDRPVLEPDDRPARGVRPDRLPLGALAAGGAVALAEGRPPRTSPDLGFRVQVSDRDRPSSPVFALSRPAPPEWFWRGSAGGDGLRVDRDPGGHRRLWQWRSTARPGGGGER